MTLIVESGNGIAGANAYIAVAYLTDYLQARNREAENGYNGLAVAAREAAIIEATDYIDTRWGPRFKGYKEFRKLSAKKAQGSILFQALPTDGTLVTVNNTAYRFGASGTVAIGTTAAEAAANLAAAVNANNPDVEATAVGSTVTFEEKLGGNHGNYLPLSSDNASLTVTAFSGGVDGGEQPLEFPRLNLYSKSGTLVKGIPLGLRQATAEYAIRAAGDTLFTDPVIDDSGREVRETAERVGPIEERTVYTEGSVVAVEIKPYPAADRLLIEYVTSGTRLIR